MVSYVVGASAGAPQLKGRLLREFDLLAQAGITLNVREEQVGEATYFQCELADETSTADTKVREDVEELFRFAIAQAVAESIVGDQETNLLRRILQARRPHYEPEEIDEVLARARLELEARMSEAMVSPRGTIGERVLTYVCEEGTLNVDGFVQFRLRAYVREWERILAATLKGYEAEKKHDEFLGALRHFMESQEPSVEELHILPNGFGSFELVDHRGSAVYDDHLERFVKDLATDGHVRREELLLSVLVTLAPMRVWCHWHPGSDVMENIERVLKERLVHCTGCARCLHQERET